MINLLEKEHLSQLDWEHDPAGSEFLPGGGLRVTVPGCVDYFQDPAGKIVKDDAPFLYRTITGDFTARVHVRPAFTTTYDAGAIMIRQDALHWAKVCFESTDFGTTAAVSVVTNGSSDDANGVNVTTPDLWLQMARQGDVFALHYALDGQDWKMVRLFRLELAETVRLGLVAQCPVGPGTQVDFLSFSIDTHPVANIRAGI
jgi:uncharacterized protein